MLLVAAAMASLPGAARAQVLVSNTGQTGFGSAFLSGSSRLAQGFTTGGNTGGYALDDVRIRMNSGFGGSDAVRVGIWSADGDGNPDAILHALANPSTVSNSALNDFAAPEGATLGRNAQYFVVVEATSGSFYLGQTGSDAEDGGAASGWSIADERHSHDGTSWTGGGTTNLFIAVRGQALANRAPTVAGGLADQMATAGSDFEYQFPADAFSDVNPDDTLQYSATLGDGGDLPAWLTFTPGTRTFAGRPTSPGTVTVKVTADDGNGGTASDSFDIVAQSRPTAADGEVTTAEDRAYAFKAGDFGFADQDSGDRLEAVRIETLPAAGALRVGSAEILADDLPREVVRAAIDRGGLTFRPAPNANGEGYASFTFKVSDGLVHSASAYTMTVDVTAVNDAPVVANGIADQAAIAGSAFSFQFPENSFSDADDDTLEHSALLSGGGDLPSWLTFTPATRTFAGTPTTAGTVTVEVTADDMNGGTVSDTFEITVRTSSASAPGQVTGVTVTARSGALRVNWTAVTGADGYRIEWKSGDQAYGSSRQAEVTGGTTVRHDIGPLRGGTEHTVRVSAYKTNTDGPHSYGPASAEVTGTPAKVTPSFYGIATVFNSEARANPNLAISGGILVWVDYPGVTPAGVGTDDLRVTCGSDCTATVRRAQWVSGQSTHNAQYRVEIAPETSGRPISITVLEDAITQGNSEAGFGGSPTTAAPFTFTMTTDAAEPVTGDFTLTGTFSEGASFAAGGADGQAPGFWPEELAGTETRPYPLEFVNGSVVSQSAAGSGAVSRTFRIRPRNDYYGILTVRMAEGQIKPHSSGVTDGRSNLRSVFRIMYDTRTPQVPPTVANAIPDQVALPGVRFEYQFPENTFADANRTDRLTYGAELENGDALPSWLAFDAGTRTFAGTPGAEDGDVIMIKVTADDGRGGTVSDTFRLQVNRPPTVANRLPDQAATAGSDFSYQFAANSFADADSDDLAYTAVEFGETGLPSWLTFTPSTRTFSGRPGDGDVGSVTVAVTADDGHGGSVSDTFEIVVLAPALVSNTGQAAASAGELVIETGAVAQRFTTGATASGYALTQVQAYLDDFVGAGVPRVRIFTTGGDGNPGESLYELTNPSSIVNGALNTFTAPAGAVLLKETRYFAVFELASGTSYRVGATASNAEDAGKATGWSIADESRFRSSNTWRANTAVQLRTAVRGADAPASAAPTVANALLDQTVIVGSDFTYQFAADSFADQDAHDRLAYTAAGLPGWLSFDASTRTFSGRPGAGDTGPSTVTVTADDRRGGTVSDAFDIVVLDPVLVGNEGSTANGLPAASRSAQAFTTGSHAGGYALTGIRLLGAFIGAGGTVTLHEGTREGTKVADLTAVNTSPGVLDDNLVLTPAAATALDANTTYVVVTANDFGAVDLWTTTASDSEDADAAAGWTIADGGEAYQSGSWGTTASAFRLTVHGTRSTAANAAPTAADSEVTATESTDLAFAADHFGYMDGDNDTLASVKVTSLPGAGLGQLLLDNTPVTSASDSTPQVVTKAQLDAGGLVYRPVAGQFGNDLASFTFRVNDGTEDSADAYTMTVDVDAASTHGVLVNNLGVTPLGTTLAVGNASGTRFTQQFFTGDHDAGYDLHSIGIDLDTNSFSGTETLTLRVYSSNEGGTAQSVLYTLTTPWSAGSEIPTSGTVYFTAPDGATLTDDTAYHLAVQGSGNSISDASIATIGGNGQSGETGWFIGNAYRQNGTLDPFEDSFKMVIRGSQRTNAAPTVANALVDQTAVAGSDFSYQFAASSFADEDGDELEYAAVESGETGLPGWLSFNASTRTFSGRPGNSDVGMVLVEVTADDGRGGTVSDTFEIVVRGPVLVSNTGQAVGNQLSIENTGVLNAQPFTTGSNASGYTLAGVEVHIGSSYSSTDVPTVRIFTSDGSGNPGDAVYTLTNPATVTGNALNSFTAPEGAVLLKETDYLVVVGMSAGNGFQIGGTASDAEDPGAATGFSIGNTRRFSSDGGASWATSSGTKLFVSVRGSNAPASTAPTVANDLADQTASVKASFTYQFAANSFADNDPYDQLTYTAQLSGGGDLPSWLTFTPSTRTFSGTPQAGDIGTVTVEVTADDGRGGTASDEFVIVVRHPVLVGNALQSLDGSPNANRGAQAFTTGAHAGGYTLQSITLYGQFPGTGTVTLHEGTREGTKVADFTAVNTVLSGEDLLTLTPDAATTLDADTSYFVVTANDFGGTSQWFITDSDSEDANAATGWSIVDASWAYQSGTSTWGGLTSSYKLTVHGVAATSANAAPTAADSEVTATESTDYPFTADNFSYSDGDSDTLASVKITSLPGTGLGLLVLDGTTIASADLPQTVTKAQLDASELVYRPITGQFGDDLTSFMFKVNDGTNDSEDAYTMTIDVDAASGHDVLVNNLSVTPAGPVLALGSALGPLYTQQFFTGDHTDGYDLHSIGIELHTNNFSGTETLTLSVYSSTANNNGAADSVLYTLTTPWSTGLQIPTGGIIYFTAPDGARLTDNTEYHLLVQSSGNTTSDAIISTIRGNGQSGESGWSIGNEHRATGTPDALGDSFKMVIRGSQRTNVAPTATDSEVTMTETTDYAFTADNFSYSDSDGDAMASVKITSIPDSGLGVIMLDGDVIFSADLPQTVTKAQLDAGDLLYRPIDGQFGNDLTSFMFKVNDGRVDSDDAYTMTVDVDAAPGHVELVSNMGQSISTSAYQVGNASGKIATQGFTAGDHTGGYDLHSVGIILNDSDFDSASETLTLSVYSSNNDGTANAVVHTLTTPWSSGQDIPEDRIIYFTAPDDATLDADTAYHLVIHGSGNAGNDATAGLTQANGQSGESGWTIEDAYRRNGTLDASSSLRMVVRGSEHTSTNAAPTAADSEVTTTENTDYPFTESDFSYSDGDSDTLASVKVTSLPSAGLGQLVLDGTVISSVSNTTPQVVTKTQIDAGELVYRPVSSQFGNDLASFTFKVNDGTDDSADAYTMTIDVDAASTHEVLVSNLEESGTTSTYSVGDVTDKTATQGFTTGSHSSGYNLHSVGIVTAHPLVQVYPLA